MNTFPKGTRVFYWLCTRPIVYATIQSSSRMPDGTQILVSKDDYGETVTLLTAGVTLSSTFWPCPHLFVFDEHRDTETSAHSVIHEMSNPLLARPPFFASRLCLFVKYEYTHQVPMATMIHQW
ncbi:uncharacterized protein LACBIDRAFT_331941 [Laccaria bicolor S238N-H82]|uniref:Predicted protein n=1 Tax=Laccaria bicolor (strain S238N-H82 / ATCC MYA-4686) TaxID=486041 RepID=B0DR40_LACBS|nr:uncharacterized protein LACBIDRAFT_331941 [Laccaria bicolor S238N-H82]EDR02932.1 predicted protein [Laccaria bicolor S238N-H82]|eukprot:XP_001886355.1 predicted protein [Laccaria bicolor S238N-H82]